MSQQFWIWKLLSCLYLLFLCRNGELCDPSNGDVGCEDMWKLPSTELTDPPRWVEEAKDGLKFIKWPWDGWNLFALCPNGGVGSILVISMCWYLPRPSDDPPDELGIDPRCFPIFCWICMQSSVHIEWLLQQIWTISDMAREMITHRLVTITSNLE